MKNKLIVTPICIVVSLLFSTSVVAQNNSRPNKDTIINREIKFWETKLQLNKKQVDEFGVAYKIDKSRKDSIMQIRFNDTTLKREKRKEFLKTQKKGHRKLLKNILTKKQYDDYIDELKKQQTLIEGKLKKSGRKFEKDNAETDD